VIKITTYLVVNVLKFTRLSQMVLTTNQEKMVTNHQFFFLLLIPVHVMLMVNGVVVPNGINVKKLTSSMVVQFQRTVFTLIFLILLWLVFNPVLPTVIWKLVLFQTNTEEFHVQS